MEKKPFLKISQQGISADYIDRQIDALEDYIDEITDALAEKLPRLIEETKQIVSKAGDLKDNAAAEFDGLEGLKKIEATTKTVHIA